MKRPEMKEFDHPIDFAKAMFQFLGQSKPMSYRIAAKKAGLTSPNYIKLLFDKQRTVGSRAVAEGLANAIELEGDEKTNFVLTLFTNCMERARRAWDTNLPLARRRVLKKQQRTHKLPKDIRGAVMVLGQEDDVDESCPGHPNFNS